MLEYEKYPMQAHNYSRKILHQCSKGLHTYMCGYKKHSSWRTKNLSFNIVKRLRNIKFLKYVSHTRSYFEAITLFAIIEYLLSL